MSYTMTYAVFLQHVDAEEQGSLLGLMSNSPLLWVIVADDVAFDIGTF